MSLTIPQLVAFDLDGTLVDSAPDIALSINRMLEEMNRQSYSEQAIRHWIGNGVETLVHRALTGEENGQAENELFATALPIFKKHYAANVCQQSQLYPNVVNVLRYLKSKPLKQAIITNKPAKFTDLLLRKLAIDEYFDLVISGDSLAKKKPDPMPLLHTAEYFNIAPHNALMIGDSTNDVFAAKAAGFKVLCVDYGYNRGIDIRESEPDMTVSDLSSLKNLI